MDVPFQVEEDWVVPGAIMIYYVLYMLGGVKKKKKERKKTTYRGNVQSWTVNMTNSANRVVYRGRTASRVGEAIVQCVGLIYVTFMINERSEANCNGKKRDRIDGQEQIASSPVIKRS